LGFGLFLGLSSGPQAMEGDAMSGSLPEHPDLDQLRRRAKELRDAAHLGDAAALERLARNHPSARQARLSLAAAQLVVARELGFPSWPRLKAAIDAESVARREVAAFIAASVDGRTDEAVEILRTDPTIAGRSLLAATVLGDANEVQGMLAANPAAAVAIDDDRGWPPLLYACYSRWHQAEADRALGLAQVVRLLLDAGASPNTNDGGRRRYRSALKGAVEANNPDITAVLLEAGANPNPGQPVGEAVDPSHHQCLQLLLSHGARVAGTWALSAAVHNDDPVAVSMLLEALDAEGAGARDQATEALPDAVAHASLPVAVALLEAGADPGTAGPDGMSVLRLAVRAGRDDIAVRLKDFGVHDDATDVDRFIGACLNTDHDATERLLAAYPDLPHRLTETDQAVIVDAASRPGQTIAFMLDCGFLTGARNDFGEQALHTAAYHGNATAVRVLLDAGADVDARDARFDATPLGFATVGSGEHAGERGDWVGTVRQLIEAGASRQGVWITGKPPSQEVKELLLHFGIRPDAPTEPQPDVQAETAQPLAAGIMTDIARHLEAAYGDGDLDLLGSLLHPDVHWTGACHNSTEVIAWYRRLLADGTTCTVESVEVDGDAVLLGLSVSLSAEDARPAPPQHLYQAFTVDDAQIVDIRAYRDRKSALARH